MEDKSSLEKLKEKYSVFHKKYSLPSFEEMNLCFSIEKSSEKETDFLLREIRHNIMDKVISYMNFVETLVNPQNASPFFFNIMKGLESDDKKKIEEIYKILGAIEIESISIGIDCEEKSEAEFIKNSFEQIRIVDKNLKLLSERFKKGWNESSNSKKDSGYLG